MGAGFALMGREVRVEMGETENFIDLLFYHAKLHCYVVVEVKATRFVSVNGQDATATLAWRVGNSYLSAVDGTWLQTEN